MGGPLLSQGPVAATRLSTRRAVHGAQVDPVTYDVDFSAVVTPPNHTKVLKVWLPLPESDALQTVTKETSPRFRCSSSRGRVEKVFDNKFAYFEFNHPEGAPDRSPQVHDRNL